MSGEDNGERDEDRQNQPQGGQPQNQPQGEQPQNQPRGGRPQNQPRGGQPQNQPQGGQPQNQPQGGQPMGQPQGGQPMGQARGRQAQTGLNVDTNYLQEWVVYLAGLFGVGGLGLGVLFVLVDAIDEPVFEASGGGLGAAVSTLSLSGIVPTILVVLSLVGLFLGTWLGQNLRGGGQELLVIAGTSVAAGAAVFFFVSSLLVSVATDGASLNFGGLVINLILVALLVGVTAAGAVVVTRNLAPRDLSVQ